ncbi:D-alanyl-D-alanine carboxypeptidase [compost metagenome]
MTVQPRTAYEIVGGKTHATTAAELAPYNVLPNEAACPCCGKIYVSFAVLRRFKRVRDAVNHALTITSGYRCNASQTYIWKRAPLWERLAGLVAKPGSSPHEYGEALDVAKPSQFRTPTDWGRFIVEVNRGDIRVGCLKYKGFAHMDTLFFARAWAGKGILW